MNKKTIFIFSLLISLVLIGNVLAITASIGNARMILRAETGDKLEKSILIKNVNNVSVDIELTASGDLEDYITVKDNNFRLEPGEEKKAFFTIEVKKSGTTESKINVQFTPVGEKNGVGLSSTITVIASGVNSDEDSDNMNIDENTDVESADSSERAVSGSITGKVVVKSLDKKYIIAFVITGIVFVVFVVLLIIYYVRFKKHMPKEISKEKNKDIKEKAKIKPKKRVKKRG